MLALMLVSCGDDGGGAGGADTAGGAGSAAATPSYTATLDVGALSVAQGSDGEVLITLTRQGGFGGDVTATLDSPPAGVSAGAVTVPAVKTRAVLTIEVEPDAALQSTRLNVQLRSGSTVVPLALDLSITPAVAGAQELIAQALDAGKIDYPTSLVYRAYAFFGDPRLPAQYRSSGPIVEDLALFIEAADPSLPAATQDLLRPFLVRPAHAASVFSLAAPRATAQRAGRRSVVEPCPAGSNATATNWRSLTSASVPIRVWLQCSVDPTLDDYDLETVRGLIEQIWTPMTALMGTPIPDAGDADAGGDSRIDFYLVGTAEAFVRQGGNQKLDEPGTLAYSLAAAPYNGNASSGFMVLNRNRLGNKKFKSDVVHEFFHVLQFAYNRKITLVAGANGREDEFWYTEASAVWGESNFARETSATEVHKRFARAFQKSVSSLHRSGAGQQMYASYIYPFFMQQRTGSAAVVQQSWNALKNAVDFDDANTKLAGVFDYDTNFRLFAVENYNADLPGVLDAGKRYKALDANFPDGVTPALADEQTLSAKVDLTPTVNVAPLRALYFKYRVEGNAIKKVVFTFDQITVRDGLDIDGLVKIQGQNWKKEDYGARSQVKFCLDDPAQQLTDMILVLSNHSLPLDRLVTGNLRVEASPVPCGGSWSGTADAAIGDLTMHAKVSFDFDDASSAGSSAAWYLPSGTVSFNVSASSGCVVNPAAHDIEPEGGQLLIDFTQTPPTYRVAAATSWVATYVCKGSSTDAGAGGIWLSDANNPGTPVMGTVNGDVIEGSSSGNGYTFTWRLERE